MNQFEHLYERTERSLPPTSEVLAVIHHFANMLGGMASHVAIWDGSEWTNRDTGERVPKGYYQLWRRLET